MNYSAAVKDLLAEISCLSSYSRLHPVVRVLTGILMLPFIIAALLSVACYHILLFLRNGSSIAADELETWLNKRKENAHFLPEAVLYFVTIPFIFFCRVLLTLFSGFLYFTWFLIMVCAYVATIGGIRWQPCLNTVNFDSEYVWGVKHSDKTFNVFGFVNWGFILLCVLQYLLEDGRITGWLIALTFCVIYIVYPKIFSKKDMHELSETEEIYAVAEEYAQVRCIANYKRASALLKRIPDYENASELIEQYDAYVASKTSVKAKVGRILMIVVGVLIVAAVVVPPVVDMAKDVSEKAGELIYFEQADGTYSVMASGSSMKTAKIKGVYEGAIVTKISSDAFYGFTDLRTVEIPNTVTQIGSYAFGNCRVLETIIFNGTIDEWYMINKDSSWDMTTGDYVVICTNGELDKYDASSDYYW